AYQIDEHILVELLPELDGYLDGQQTRLGVVAVDVENRRLDHLRDVGAIERPARVARIGSREADLIIDHDVDRATGAVAARLRKVERLLHHALPRDRG